MFTDNTILVGAISLVCLLLSTLVFFKLSKPPTVLPQADFTKYPLVKKESLSHDTRRFTFGLPKGHVLGLPTGQHMTSTHANRSAAAKASTSSSDRSGRMAETNPRVIAESDIATESACSASSPSASSAATRITVGREASSSRRSVRRAAPTHRCSATGCRGPVRAPSHGIARRP